MINNDKPFYRYFWGAVASAVGGLFGMGATALNNKSNLEAVRETNKANRELAEYQYLKNREMWDANNAYNTPLAQRQRLEEAGLNPNLVYGNGSLANTSSGQLPQYNAPTLQTPRFEKYDTSFVGQSAAMALQQLQYENQKRKIDSDVHLQESQSAANDANRLLTMEKISNAIQDRAKSKFDLDLAKQLRQYTVAGAMLNNQQAQKQLQVYDEQLKSFPLQRAELIAQTELLKFNKNLSIKQAEQISKNCLKIGQEIVNLQLQGKVTAEQARSLGLSNDITESTKEEAIYQATLKTTQMLLDNTNKKLTNLWHVDHGFSTDIATSIAASIMHQYNRATNE